MKIKKLNGKKPDYADDSYYAEIVNDDGSVVGLILYGESAPIEYDHNRTARMIEKIEEGFKIIKLEKEGIEAREKANLYPEDIVYTNTSDDEYKQMVAYLNYIEHGDKQKTPLDMLKTLLEYYKQGASQAVMDNYWKDVERVVKENE